MLDVPLLLLFGVVWRDRVKVRLNRPNLLLASGAIAVSLFYVYAWVQPWTVSVRDGTSYDCCLVTMDDLPGALWVLSRWIPLALLLVLGALARSRPAGAGLMLSGLASTLHAVEVVRFGTGLLPGF